MTPKQLQRRGEYWQEVLGLSIWDISYKFASTLEIKGAWADNTFDPLHRRAIVRVVDEKWYALVARPIDPPFCVDINIVHELLHLVLEPLGVNDGIDGDITPLEQTINLLADIIVKLHEGT